MSLIKERDKIILKKFQELLRSGKDYSVESMCNEVGKHVFMEGVSIVAIINRHYREAITKEMVEYVNSLKCSRDEEIKLFSKRFGVCRRESILIIRYIRRKKNGRAD